MKVAELEDEELDYWTAKAGEVWKTAHEMFPAWTMDPRFKGVEIIDGKCVLIPNNPFRQDPKIYSPSTNWSQGGPIIAASNISIIKEDLCSEYRAGFSPTVKVHSFNDGDGYFDTEEEIIMEHDQFGETALIAAMRSYVASKFGKEVDDSEADHI